MINAHLMLTEQLTQDNNFLNSKYNNYENNQNSIPIRRDVSK